MSEPPAEDYCDALKDSAEGNKSQDKGGAIASKCKDSNYNMNFDLDQKKPSAQYSIAHDEDDDDDCCDFEEHLIRKGKFQTARENLKKINSMVKSKIDVLGRVPMFGGKKKAGGKRLSLTKDSKQGEVKAEHLPQTQGDPTYSVLNVVNDEVDCNTSDNSNINSSVASDSSQIWPENISASEFSASFPQKSNNVLNVDTKAAPMEQYRCDIPASLPPLETTSSPHSQNNSTDTDLHYSEVASQWTDTIKSTASIKSTTSSITPSVNRGWLEGVGPAVPVDFINPVSNLFRDDGISSEYNKLYLNSTKHVHSESQNEQPENKTPERLSSSKSEITNDDLELQSEEPDCHSNVELHSESEEDNYWGSEFDDDSSYQDEVLSEDIGYDIGEAPEKPLPPKPEKKVFFLRAKSSSSDIAFPDDTSSTCHPVIINPQKHSLPVLPPQPSGLTQNQIKRRMVIDSIIGSERSYLESLERLVTEYEKTVLEYISKPKSHIRLVFARMREIISHHQMFQIELSECVKVWDEEEKIGDIFTASFSKTMLINAYSIYVNNFAAAMDEIRSLQRSRQSFQDFLLKQQKLSCDRLSMFGLMVKPVQRFPQFIMFLQDLIKFTPQNHHDRRALQLALTELENVAYRLNERKRHSEQKFQTRQIAQQLIKHKVQHVLDTWSLDMDPKRRLIRRDNVEQVLQNGEFENIGCKNRQLVLMNDHVLCVKVIQKEQSGYLVEKYALRWLAKLKDLELKDTNDLRNVNEQELWNINISQQPAVVEDDPFHLLVDLHEMVHDHLIIKHITGLVSMLKRSYAGHGLKEGLIHEISNDLQHMIQIKEEQLRLVSSCSIILQDTARSDKPNYILQTQTAAIKHDWCLDFLIAKLAMDKSNNLAWDGTSGSDGSECDVIPAYFMKHIPVDVPRHYTKIKCAVSISLNPRKSANGLGLQHLWVCSSTPEHGQVSILSVHNSKPALTESFRACESDIMAVELVSGCGDVTKSKNLLFAEDTVWMATYQNEILIFPLTSNDGVHRQPFASVKTSVVTISLKFVNMRLFCGSTNGVMTVYTREEDGGWDVSNLVTLSFGSTFVKFHFIHEKNIWLSCDNRLCQLDTDSLQTQADYVLNANHESHIDHVVKSGVGIWVSFCDCSVIKLFHLETMENLQELSVGNFVSRIYTEKSWGISGASDSLTVTCLSICRGLLWIGTSIGVVLTVPLPRLSDGVPLYRGSPKLSLHAHKGPVRFILPLQCFTSFTESNKADSSLSTTEARHSWQNLESKKTEQEELEIRKERTVSDNTKVSYVDNEDMILVSKDCSQMLPLLPAVETADNSETNVLSLSRQTANGSRILTDDNSVQLRNKSRPSEMDHRSKTLSYSSDLLQHMVKSRVYSQSHLDLTSEEPHEVEVLYKALLEDDPDIQESKAINGARNTAVSGVKGKRWSFGSTVSTPVSRLSTHLASPSGLNMSSSVHVQQSSCQEYQFNNLKTGDQSFTAPDISSSTTNASMFSSAFHPQSKASDILQPSDQSFISAQSFLESKAARLTPTRKINSNTVVVVSGGDGYSDLDFARRETKMDDACVLLWIHKFY